MDHDSARPDAVHAVRGALVGAVAYGLGYGLTYAWRAPAIDDALQGLNFLAQLLGVDAIPTWKGVGWLFYGAHGVATRFPTPGGGSELLNLVEQSGDASLGLLYVVVPVLLILAGALSARWAHAEKPVEAMMAGALVTVGYGALAAIGTVVFAHGIGETGRSIGADPVTGFLLAGLVYPIVCGAIGGLLVGLR